MQGLTERQAAVLAYIRDYQATSGYPPTLREIGAHMGIRSTNGVTDHLRALEKKGAISRADMKSRGITLTGPDAPAPRPPPLRWDPSGVMRLRTILAEYNLIATRGGKLVTDFAADLAAKLAREGLPSPV